jgi:hypothetical protein
MCRLSELGHYNFSYPSQDSALFFEKTFVSKLSWVSYKNLIPVSVSVESLRDVCGNTMDFEGKEHAAVWVDSESLLRYQD